MSIADPCLISIKQSFKTSYLEFCYKLLFNTAAKYSSKKDLVSQILKKAKFVLVQILISNSKFLFVPLSFSAKAGQATGYLQFISELNKTDPQELEASCSSLETVVNQDNKYLALERVQVLLNSDPANFELITIAQMDQNVNENDMLLEIEEIIDDAKSAGPSIVRDLNTFSLSQSSRITLIEYKDDSNIADWLQLSLSQLKREKINDVNKRISIILKAFSLSDATAIDKKFTNLSQTDQLLFQNFIDIVKNHFRKNPAMVKRKLAELKFGKPKDVKTFFAKVRSLTAEAFPNVAAAVIECMAYETFVAKLPTALQRSEPFRLAVNDSIESKLNILDDLYSSTPITAEANTINVKDESLNSFDKRDSQNSGRGRGQGRGRGRWQGKGRGEHNGKDSGSKEKGQNQNDKKPGQGKQGGRGGYQKGKGKQNKTEGDKKDRSHVTCYNCQGKGHFKNQCPSKF